MDRRSVGLGIKFFLALLLTIIAIGNLVLLVISGRNDWVLDVVVGFVALLAVQAWYQFVLARRKWPRSGPA